MSWTAEAFGALKKIILLEERVSQLADRVDGVAQSLTEMDRRLIRVETKFETYESIAKQRRPRRLPEA